MKVYSNNGIEEIVEVSSKKEFAEKAVQKHFYVVFSVGNEDPEAICAYEHTAKKVVDRLVAEGREVWYESWIPEEFKDG